MKPQIHPSAKILFEEAEKLGLSPQWETPYGLFSFISKKGKKQYVYYTKLFSNSQLGAWISQDKYATRLVLAAHDVPMIPYCYSSQLTAVNRFFDKHQKIVKKPLYGEKAEGVELITSHTELEKIVPRDFLFEKYIPGIEYRVWVLQGKGVAQQKKEVKPTKGSPWHKYVTNLEVIQWNTSCTEMAIKIAKILHMTFLAVDFIQDREGHFLLLEVNSMPGIYFLHHPHAGKPINMAKMLLQEQAK